MSNRISVLVTALLVCCALALVNSQFQARRLMIELERAQAQERQLNLEYAQLQLDQSTLGKNARIDTIARDLHMVPLTAARTQYMTPDATPDATPVTRPVTRPEAPAGNVNKARAVTP
jgi:cell division protein FtsL